MDHKHLLRRGGILPTNGGIEIILVMIENDAGDGFALPFQHPQRAGGQGRGGGLAGGVDPQRPVGGAVTGGGFVGEQLGVVVFDGIEIIGKSRTKYHRDSFILRCNRETERRSRQRRLIAAP